MSLEDYGWKVTEGQVLPRMTDQPAAPELLLQMIRCNCSSDCASARCTCRKHGLECSPACGQCRGTACTNSPMQFAEDDRQDETLLDSTVRVCCIFENISSLSVCLKRSRILVAAYC